MTPYRGPLLVYTQIRFGQIAFSCKDDQLDLHVLTILRSYYTFDWKSPCLTCIPQQ